MGADSLDGRGKVPTTVPRDSCLHQPWIRDSLLLLSTKSDRYWLAEVSMLESWTVLVRRRGDVKGLGIMR